MRDLLGRAAASPCTRDAPTYWTVSAVRALHVLHADAHNAQMRHDRERATYMVQLICCSAVQPVFNMKTY